MKFEALIPKGKKLHELTEEEIEDIISQCSREEIERFESEVRKSTRKTTSTRSIAAKKKKEDEFNNLLLGIKPK